MGLIAPVEQACGVALVLVPRDCCRPLLASSHEKVFARRKSRNFGIITGLVIKRETIALTSASECAVY